MVKLYNGDCLNVMKDISDKSIDMILCDLPYGTTPLTWDKEIPMDKLWIEYKRVLKDNGVVVLFGQEPFSSYLRISNIDWYKYDWYWEKESFTNVFQVKRRPGKNVETISVFYKNQPTYNPQKYKHEGKPVTNKIGDDARFSSTQIGNEAKVRPLEYVDDMTRYPKQVIRVNRENKRKAVHPTQKPVALLEYLIKTYTNENELVLDNCMGSGSCGVACINTDRNFIGIELDENYFNIAKDRIENKEQELKESKNNLW